MAIRSGLPLLSASYSLHGKRARPKRPFLILIAFLLLAPVGASFGAQSEYAGRGGVAAANSVYRLTCPDQDRGGTAFGHKSGRIITAEHVIHGCDSKKLLITAFSGQSTGVSEVVGDTELDLALLIPQVADFVKSPLTISPELSFTFGSQVSTWGFPDGYLGRIPLLTIGQLAGVEDMTVGTNRTVTKWVVNGAFNLGNSGGPLVETRSAKVFGVITGKVAPIPETLVRRLQELKEKGSANEQTIAEAILYLRLQTQLVIGLAVTDADLRKFLKHNGIDP